MPFVWTLRETLALCEASAPNVGVTLDAWHWHHSGGTVADIRAADASRIVHVHVSDARAMPPEEVRDDMRLLPGEGVIDLVGFFGALKSIGYRGGVAPETIGPRIPDTMPAEESARLALEATTAVMRKAGVGIVQRLGTTTDRHSFAASSMRRGPASIKRCWTPRCWRGGRCPTG